MAAAARDSIRYWAGAVGAAAMVAGIVSVVVMVQMQKPTKTKTAPPPRTAAAPQPRPAATPPAWTVAAQQKSVAPQQKSLPPAAPKTEAAAPPRTVSSIQTTPKTTPEPKAVPTAAALTDAERKMSEELWVEQKRLDTGSARVAATPEGRKRVAAMIAKQYNVPDKLVGDLRDRKLGYGEISASLAFSQQLMKRNKSTRQQALDRVLAARKSGQGWAAFARSAGLKIGDALAEVKKTDAQVAKATG